MAVGAFAFSVMSLFVKVAGSRFSTHEIVFFRSAGVTLISGIYLLRARTPVRAQRPGLLVFRGLQQNRWVMTGSGRLPSV